MTATVTPGPAGSRTTSAGPPPLSRGRLAVRTLGELLITAGVVVLLFAAYQLFWTNVSANRSAEAVTQQLSREFTERPPADPGQPAPVPTFSPGQGFALLHIPRLGEGWVRPVVQGVALDDLHTGIGHYPGTAMPGKVGNFALAGHRATNGEPFRDLDRMRPGDLIVVEDRTGWYTYRVDGSRIVPPTQVGVVLPVPDRPGVKPTKAIITLTTCNPRWASYERLIVHGVLVAATPRADGPPAVLQQGA